jgi:hypothetical protein
MKINWKKYSKIIILITINLFFLVVYNFIEQANKDINKSTIISINSILSWKIDKIKEIANNYLKSMSWEKVWLIVECSKPVIIIPPTKSHDQIKNWINSLSQTEKCINPEIEETVKNQRLIKISDDLSVKITEKWESLYELTSINNIVIAVWLILLNFLII